MRLKKARVLIYRTQLRLISYVPFHLLTACVVSNNVNYYRIFYNINGLLIIMRHNTFYIRVL